MSLVQTSISILFVPSLVKTTQRPHLHGSFLIADGTKYVQFVEICRECWSLTFETDRKGHKRLVHRLGYMFPKRKHGVYVDDKGRNRDPRFRSQLAGAKYVCKYVCKDLAYMDDDRVKNMMHEPYFSYYLPKSYKSNNLGFGPIERILETGDNAKIQLMLKKRHLVSSTAKVYSFVVFCHFSPYV